MITLLSSWTDTETVEVEKKIRGKYVLFEVEVDIETRHYERDCHTEMEEEFTDTRIIESSWEDDDGEYNILDSVDTIKILTEKQLQDVCQKAEELAC